MKLFLISLTTLISTSSFALQVGDSATYVITAGDQTIQSTQTVTQISGDEYSVEAVATANGQTQTVQGTGSISELEQIDYGFQNCVAAGGSYEQMNVGALGLQACHLVVEGQEVFISPVVTFGLVKMIAEQNGVQMTIALTAFRKQ